MILLESSPDAEMREALKFYASKKYGVEFPAPPGIGPHRAASVLKDLGIVHGFVYHTIVIIK